MVDKIIMEEDWVGEGGSISNCLGGGGASSHIIGTPLSHIRGKLDLNFHNMADSVDEITGTIQSLLFDLLRRLKSPN